MSINVNKVKWPDIVLFIAVAVQVLLIVLNCIEPQDDINYIMFVNNYVIGFCIILSLFFKGVAAHMLAIAFFGCYMLFLMAQKPFKPLYDAFLTFTMVQLNTHQYFIFSVILFLGLCVTYYSYLHYNSKNDNNSFGEVLTVSEVDDKAIKPFLTVMLVLTLPCALYMQGYIVMVRGSLGYVSGYLINVDVPVVIKIGYYLYSTIVLLYLALKPSKMQMAFVLATYLIIEGGLQIFQGRRALFASTLLFIIWYLFKYYEIKKLNLKTTFRVLTVLVALIVVFIVVEQSRDNASVRLTTQLFIFFLISTGGSDSVIANTIYRESSFPASGLAYLLDPFLNNFIINFLLGKTSSAQGMAYLQQHNSFSHWISYLTNSSLYLSGHGMGTSYLAEVYLAFGLVGVLVVSILLGCIINKFSGFQFSQNIFRSAFVFFLVRRLFTLPRGGLFSWVSGLVYVLFTFALIYPFYPSVYWRHKKEHI